MYRLSLRPYSREFRLPLQTQHGHWQRRQGIILRLMNDEGRVAFGEIVPLEWFGTETLEQASHFCHQLPATLTADWLRSIPADLPACRFGFESAWEMLTNPNDAPVSPLVPTSGLLPTGDEALQSWRSLWQQGYRTLKWKIGVTDWQEELGWFTTLIQNLPAQARLRLDANGGLDRATACRWLEACSDRPQVEFLEQPLPPEQLDGMLALSNQYSTPIALDESVATLTQLETCYRQGWRGIVVIKAAIAGSPRQLREFCQTHSLDLVWSSVFETAIAQQFIQSRLIPSLPHQHRATGFGVHHWFTDHWHRLSGEQLWQLL